MGDDTMTAAEAAALLAGLEVRRCDECDARDPAESLEGDRVLHAGCPRWPRGEVYVESHPPPLATVARALRAVVALHERAAARDGPAPPRGGG